MEGRANGGRRAKSSEAADALNRLGRRLQQLARSVEASVGEPCHRRYARLFAKSTGECSSRHVRLLGKCVEVKRTREIFQHPVPKGREFGRPSHRVATAR